jgi:hypothetical protein
MLCCCSWLLSLLDHLLALPQARPPLSYKKPRLSKYLVTLSTCTDALACCLFREGKNKVHKKALLLPEVQADSLELCGSHKKLIVFEGIARLLPFPNLISRLCHEVRIRVTLKIGKGRKKFHHQSSSEACKVPFLVPKELPISLR